jgi:hypothetical protein
LSNKIIQQIRQKKQKSDYTYTGLIFENFFGIEGLLPHQMFLKIMLGALSRDHFEVLVKAGEVGEAALKAQLLDADAVVYEQLAGVSYTYLREELRIGLSRAGFKITAKGIGYQSCDCGYLFEIDLLREMTEGVVVDRIDPVILHFGEIMPEADGGQQVKVGYRGKGGKTFDEGDDPAYAFTIPDLLYQRRDIAMFSCVYPDAPSCLFQQMADGFGLRQLQKWLAPEVLREMNHGGMNFASAVFVKIWIVVPPVMGQVGTYQDNIPGIEPGDMIANELCSASLMKIDELNFGMIVPAIIDVRVPVFTNTE